MNKKELFDLCVEVVNAIGDDLCMDTIITVPTKYTSPNYRNCENENNVYYICSNRGLICYDSVIKFSTTFFKDTNETSLDDFTMWCGNVKEQVIKDKNNDSIMWYEMFDCPKGEYHIRWEINSVDDLLDLLCDRYYMQDMYDCKRENLLATILK